MLYFGAKDIGAAPGELFLAPGFVNGPALTDNVGVTVAESVTIMGMFIRQNTLPGGAGATYTLYLDGVAAAAIPGVMGSVPEVSDTSLSVYVEAGQTLSVGVSLNVIVPEGGERNVMVSFSYS